VAEGFPVSETLTPGQRRTMRAREALAAKFATPEAKSDHYRRIGAFGNEGRLVLSGDEAAALANAYHLLGAIARKAGAQWEPDPPPEDKEVAAGDGPAAQEGR
jgi:hypothetical protein